MKKACIHYIMIARECRILCDYTPQKNFALYSFVYKYLSKFEEGRMVLDFPECQFMFIKEADDNIVYLVLVDFGYDKIEAFKLLDQVKVCFHNEINIKRIGKVKEYGLNDFFRPVLEEAAEYWENKGTGDLKIDLALDKLNSLKTVMNENIIGLIERDEKLEPLLEKTGML